MSLLKKIQKNIKMYHIVALLGFVILVVALNQYSNKQSNLLDGMNTEMSNDENDEIRNVPQYLPANPAGENSGPGLLHSQPLPDSVHRPSCDPSQLLPKDNNNSWGNINPVSNSTSDSSLANQNFLQAGALAGINTIGSSNRNANLQLRKEHPNPTTNVGPWNQSTIEPDQWRKPLDGCD